MANRKVTFHIVKQHRVQATEHPSPDRAGRQLRGAPSGAFANDVDLEREGVFDAEWS